VQRCCRTDLIYEAGMEVCSIHMATRTPNSETSVGYKKRTDL
jgi:hypothetical protein